MAAASYYDNGDLPSQSAGRQAESHMDQQMHGQGERGYPQQATDGQQQMMGNSAQAQGSAQPMTNGNAATGGEKAAVADDRDGLTKCNDNLIDHMNDLLTPPCSSLMQTGYRNNCPCFAAFFFFPSRGLGSGAPSDPFRVFTLQGSTKWSVNTAASASTTPRTRRRTRL